MTEPWWEDPLLVVLGSALAILSQLIGGRYRRARRAKVAAISLAHEMKGVTFSSLEIGGFSGEAFDGLLIEIPNVFPQALAEEALGYHWRMKHLEDVIARPEVFGGAQPTPGDFQEIARRRDKLVTRLERYRDQPGLKRAFPETFGESDS